MNDISCIIPSQDVVLKKTENDEIITPPKQENIEKTYKLPQEAVDTLKASVLYKNNSDYKQYIPGDATPKEVRDILADKKQVGRSFFGYKRAIRKGIERSKNPELAIDNLNYLLNADNGKLKAGKISQIMAITEQINNNDSGATAEHLRKHYGFDGGKLDKESFDKINSTIHKDNILTGALMADFMVQQQTDNMIMQNNFQQMVDQQNIINQQNMINQQMMNQQIINNQMMGF